MYVSQTKKAKQTCKEDKLMLSGKQKLDKFSTNWKICLLQPVAFKKANHLCHF